jgi:hypothetical protein
MRYFPWASALMVGLVAGVLLARLPHITIQKTIDLDGMISLFVGLVLFFGLNLLYQQKSTVRQGEKDILMKLAKDGLAASAMLDSTFCRHYKENPLTQAAIEEIFAGLQRYNNEIHTLEAALAQSQMKSKLDLTQIQRNREEYRAVLTDSPFTVSYDSGTYRKQQAHQRAVREGFVSFMLQMNRVL